MHGTGKERPGSHRPRPRENERHERVARLNTWRFSKRYPKTILTLSQMCSQKCSGHFKKHISNISNPQPDRVKRTRSHVIPITCLLKIERTNIHATIKN